ncbi:MAG: thrombospondin type 3 repeat-containing protein [Patescibacteria group bacterium]
MKLNTIFNRANLAIVIGLCGVAFGVKSHFDEQAIVAEMQRQVGNADHTAIGARVKPAEDENGRLIEDAEGRYVHRTVPVHAWDVLWEHDDKIKEIESRLEGLDEPEVELLGSDAFWNMVRIQLLDGDFDNDGVVNVDDYCPDLPGLGYDTIGADPNQMFEGCPASTDSDKDGIANYRDACPNQLIPEGWAVYDNEVVRGPRSLFPSDQGCAFPTAEPAAAAAPAPVDSAPPVAAAAPVVPASVEVWVCDKPGASVQFSGSSQAGWKLTCDGTVWACGNKAANPDGTVTLNKEDCTAAN